MISRLHIRGYRSVRDIRLNLTNLNVLTGINGCGKSNLYRSLMLLQSTAAGRFSEMIAEEGGMPSILWAGPATKDPRRMDISVSFTSGLSYEIQCGAPDPDSVPVVFKRDPHIRCEKICVNKSIMVDRGNTGVMLRTDAGDRVTVSVSPSESVLSQIVDPARYPWVTSTRFELASWRFYHAFRTDEGSPIRQPQICSMSPVLSSDGRNLAAAILTIYAIGDRESFEKFVFDALGGAKVVITVDDNNRCRIQLVGHGLNRPLEASELSDGTLRFLCLLAAMLSPRPPKLIGLNEPETSLHPDVLPSLAKIIAKVAITNQVWMVTHAVQLAADVTRQFGNSPLALCMRAGATEACDSHSIDGAFFFDKDH